MQILIAAMVVLSLWAVELGGERSAEAGAVSDWQWRVLATFSFAAAVPVFGWLMSLSLRAGRPNECISNDVHRQMVGRLNLVQVGVWAVACSAIVFIGQWGAIVKFNWQLDRFLLLDEIVTLAPIILPLIASWAVLFDLEKHSNSNTGMTTKNRQRARLDYCLLRIQVYVALTMIPMVILWLTNDIGKMFFHESGAAKWSLMFIALFVSILGFPMFLKIVWPNRRLDDPGLKQRINLICQEKNVKISDVRIWQTGNRVTNAMVTGFVWPLRSIWVSDALLSRLNPEEVETVLRHEVGHAKRNHLLYRVSILALPFLMAIALVIFFPERLEVWAERFADAGISSAWLAWVLVPTLGICYLLWALNWFSHRIEKDADIEACLATPSLNLVMVGCKTNRTIDSGRVANFKSAMLKIAGQIPGGIEKQTLMHPSVIERSQFLTQMMESDAAIFQFRRQLFLTSIAICVSVFALFAVIVFI